MDLSHAKTPQTLNKKTWGPFVKLIKLIQSHELTYLTDCLAQNLAQQPAKHALTPTIILTDHRLTAGWLRRALADRLGITLAATFFSPREFIDYQLRRPGPANQLDSVTGLQWLLYRLLTRACTSDTPDTDTDTGRPSWWQYLKPYLTNTETTARQNCYRLAQDLAGVFYNYQFTHPQWLSAAEQGQYTEPLAGSAYQWQAELWNDLVLLESSNQDSSTKHRIQLLDSFLNANASDHTPQSPERIHLYCLSNLDPALRLILQHPPANSSEQADIILYQLKLATPASDHGNSNLRPVLKMLEPMELECQQQVQTLSAQTEPAQLPPASDPPEHLLAAVQSALLNPDAPSRLHALPADNSIQLHNCHSRLREVQILRDQIYLALSTDTHLKASDFMVAAPDITAYQQEIEAVFGTEDAQVPWTLSAQTSLHRYPLTRLLLQLLDPAQSPLSLEHIFQLVAYPDIAATLRIKPSETATLKQLLYQAGGRFGCIGLEQGANNSYSLDQAFATLLRRFVLPPEAGASPSVDWQTTQQLSSLYRFVYKIHTLRAAIEKHPTLDEWHRICDELCALVQPVEATTSLQLAKFRFPLLQILAQAARAKVQQLPHEVLYAELSTRLNRHEGGKFLAGGISFYSLSHQLPASSRIICLLGMNSGAFPRHQQQTDFDLRNTERPLAECNRSQDIQAFLQALMMAQDALWMFYQGRSARDNAPLAPSVVVSELLSLLPETTSQALRHVHPLQPFSASYGHKGSTFGTEWLPHNKNPVPKSDSTGSHVQLPFLSSHQPHPTNNQLQLTQLQYFLADPARYYLRQRGLRLSRPQPQPDPNEPYSMAGLNKWQSGNLLLETHTADTAADIQDLQLLKRASLLPKAQDLMFQEQKIEPLQLQVQELHDAIRQEQGGNPTPTRSVSLELDEYSLQAQLPDAHKLLRWRYGQMRPIDELNLWIEHLFLSAMGKQIPSQHLHLSGTQRKKPPFWCNSYSINPLSEQRARNCLQQIIQYYHKAHQQPMPFFPAASLTYINALSKKADRAGAMRQSLQILKANSSFQKGDLMRSSAARLLYPDLLLPTADTDSTDDATIADTERTLPLQQFEDAAQAVYGHLPQLRNTSSKWTG